MTYFLSMGSFFLLFAFYLQQGRGLSALQSGLLFIALGAGYFGTSMLAAPLSGLLGRQLVAVGPLTMALGYGLVALTVQRPVSTATSPGSFRACWSPVSAWA